MRHRRIALVALIAIAPFITTTAVAQTVRYGVVMDSLRDALAHAWTTDSTQVERAYCIQAVRISARPISATAVDTVFRVIRAVAARVRRADPNHVDFECNPGTPELHTHTPATCLNDDPRFCVAEGPLAYSCQPSREDFEKLIRRGDSFAIVQCDRKAFRFYYPSEFVESRRRDATGAAKPPSPDSQPSQPPQQHSASH